MSEQQASIPRFMHPEYIEIGDGVQLHAREVAQMLGPFISEPRRAKIEAVLRERTCTVATVCEGIYDKGNVSAVMRSAESMGFQQMHVIHTQKRFKVANRVSMGSDKWLDIANWRQTEACVERLKAQGYRIVATHLDETAVPIDELDFTQPTALVFGNEHAGISEEMIALSDVRCIIPMRGFAQSFNISVAAAVSLYHVAQDRIRRQGYHGDLSEEELERLRASYYMRALQRPMTLLQGAVQQRGERVEAPLPDPPEYGWDTEGEPERFEDDER